MGNRAQVTVAGAGVSFYIHVGGHEVFEHVASGLAKARDAGRLDQPDALAHILFDAINTDPGATRGYGISDEPYEGVYRTVTVDGDRGIVEVDTIYEVDDDEGRYDIDDFVATYAEDAEVTAP